ncbi:TetR/AcrR family transcriptional regulator [Actinokineospora sp. HUAS TT18]|uniref:TetR/AcrR family transcriptional regulator n=1 Tax=Actinokineospora sp. HUAS TT18 TaxID=3447451 RepID=UPI003F522E6F
MANVIDLLWGPRATPSRGPKPGLTVERIAASAIAIADAEGLDAVSMQRVAADVGVTKMAIYRYVPGKAELVALMADIAVGPPDFAAADGWRAGLTAWAEALLPRFKRHRWLLAATVGPRAVGPNELAWLDRGIAILDGTGLGGAERMDAVVVVVGHLRTIAEQSESSERQLGAVIAEVMATRAAEFPALGAALADGGRRDDALAFGLARILDGLGVLIDSR